MTVTDQILAELKALRKEVVELRAEVRKDKVTDTWIDEPTAAKMIGYEPRTLRRWCKAGKLQINFRNTNGRSYQYSRKDLKSFLTQTSTQ